jgi:hypothetical protein
VLPGCAENRERDQQHTAGEEDHARDQQADGDPGSAGSVAATLTRTLTGADPSAFMATSVQRPSAIGQVSVWVPGPVTFTAQIRLPLAAGNGRVAGRPGGKSWPSGRRRSLQDGDGWRSFHLDHRLRHAQDEAPAGTSEPDPASR